MSSEALERVSTAPSGTILRADSSVAVFVARSVVPGCVATALIAVGALGVGWLPMQRAMPAPPVVNALQSTMPGTIAAASALVIGVCLLLFAWLQLGQDISREPATDVRRLWLTLAAWAAPLIVTPPLFSRDVYSYVGQGKLMAAGLNPYTHGPSSLPGWLNDGVDPMWADSPSPYGQVFNMLAGGVVDIGGPNPYVGALLFRVLALVGVGLLAWAVPQLASAYGVSPAWALWLGVLNPLVLMHFVSGAHNDALMIGLIAAGLALTLRKQPMLGVLLVTLAGAVKPIGFIALPFVGLLWAGTGAPMYLVIRRWVASAAACLAVMIGLAVLTGTGFSWLNSVNTSSSVRTWLSPPTALGMALGSGLELGGFDVLDSLVTASRALGALIAFALIAYLYLRPGSRTPVRAVGLVFLVVVLLGPVAQPWYLLWSLPLLAAAALTRFETRVMIFGTIGLTFFSLGSHFLDGAGYT